MKILILSDQFENGEPIVETPRDAIKSFRTTNLNALILNNYLILR